MQMKEIDKITTQEMSKIGIEISDPDARKHIYGISYDEWKKKYQKK